jgi:16S rRNA (guanine(966)-N(2))-methyltransferase RsmD
MPGSVFVDAYAGSGAVGIEALSRGAARVIFIDKKRASVELIRENLRSLGVVSGFEIHQGQAARVLARVSGEIVFLDPPYDLLDEYTETLRILSAHPPSLAILQHSKRVKLDDAHGRLYRSRILRQGDNDLSFYEPVEPVIA